MEGPGFLAEAAISLRSPLARGGAERWRAATKRRRGQPAQWAISGLAIARVVRLNEDVVATLGRVK
jgi:hypothetical protein